MSEIIKALRAKRLEMNLNQAELGRKLGLPQSHISKIEGGGTDPRLSTVMDMARLLEMELLVVPIHMQTLIQTIISGEDEQNPMWSEEEE